MNLGITEQENSTEAKRKVFYIPDIFLVGYGRAQTYQNRCLDCHKEFFCIEDIRQASDLFCDECQESQMEIPSENISSVNYVGNLVGWLAKTVSNYKGRPLKNYKKTYERDRYTCQYCGYNLKNATKFQALHIDHIKPWSSMGGNSLKNLVVSCQECNLIAGERWFDNFDAKKKFILLEKNKRIPCVKE